MPPFYLKYDRFVEAETYCRQVWIISSAQLKAIQITLCNEFVLCISYVKRKVITFSSEQSKRKNHVTAQERAAAVKISRIIRAARKQLGLNQETIAKQLSISQSALSKLEHGTLIPSAPQWFEFCRTMGIAPESFIGGYIERNRAATLQHGDREGTFKLPKKYCANRGSKVRAVLPFLNYLKNVLGEKKQRELIKSFKVDPDFFVDLDNQISLQFSLDIGRYLIKEKLLKASDIGKLTKPIGTPELHGALHANYAGKQDPILLLTALLLNSRLYECNFKYSIEDQNKNLFEFSVEPEKHMSSISYKDDELGDFLCRYKRSYFERFAYYGQAEAKKNFELEEVECHFHGAPKCVFRLKSLEQ